MNIHYLSQEIRVGLTFTQLVGESEEKDGISNKYYKIRD